MLLASASTLTSEEWNTLHQIYHNSFPVEEQRPWELILRPEDEAFSLYALRTPEIGLVGMATLWSFDTFIYIEHLAISEQHRSRGLGQEFFACLRASGVDWIVLEAEPRETSELASRRLDFYARQGLFPQPYAYQQPPYTEETGWVDLLLLSNRPLTRPDFERIRSTLYSRVYGVSE